MKKLLKIKINKYHEVFEKVEELLKHDIDSQIFISDEICELMSKGKEDAYTTGRVLNNIYKINTMKTRHYMHDSNNFGGEDCFKKTKGCLFDESKYYMSLISNFREHKTLVQFKSKEIDYTHFLAGANKLVFIDLG